MKTFEELEEIVLSYIPHQTTNDIGSIMWYKTIIVNYGLGEIKKEIMTMGLASYYKNGESLNIEQTETIIEQYGVSTNKTLVLHGTLWNEIWQYYNSYSNENYHKNKENAYNFFRQFMKKHYNLENFYICTSGELMYISSFSKKNENNEVITIFDELNIKTNENN